MTSSPPERVAIDPDDYAAQHVGHTPDGRQVFATVPFVPALAGNPGREFLAVYVFDARGGLLEAHIDDLGPRATLDLRAAQQLRERRLAELGGLVRGRIEVCPFQLERFGVTFGLVARPPDADNDDGDEDGWWVEAHPGNYMAFHAPWDSGEYDT